VQKGIAASNAHRASQKLSGNEVLNKASAYNPAVKQEVVPRQNIAPLIDKELDQPIYQTAIKSRKIVRNSGDPKEMAEFMVNDNFSMLSPAMQQKALAFQEQGKLTITDEARPVIWSHRELIANIGAIDERGQPSAESQEAVRLMLKHTAPNNRAAAYDIIQNRYRGKLGDLQLEAEMRATGMPDEKIAAFTEPSSKAVEFAMLMREMDSQKKKPSDPVKVKDASGAWVNKEKGDGTVETYQDVINAIAIRHRKDGVNEADMSRMEKLMFEWQQKSVVTQTPKTIDPASLENVKTLRDAFRAAGQEIKTDVDVAGRQLVRRMPGVSAYVKLNEMLDKPIGSITTKDKAELLLKTLYPGVDQILGIIQDWGKSAEEINAQNAQ
jgi:hypothetical protein